VPANSKIQSIADLVDKKLGIAGGELDKNWLLLQALAEQQNINNFNQSVEKIYAAPPLLNQQLFRQRTDAIMTYWHYAAKLEAKGFKQLLNGQDILLRLGITQKMPTLGYVFNRQWAMQHKPMINQFLKATQQAKDQLCHTDKVWQQIIPMTKAKDLVTQNILRDRYCAGRIKQWGINELQAAEKIYTLLRKLSDNKLTGSSETLQAGTFWNME
jgi:NitT/TauT family transport system substrate-binding protein